LELYDIFNGKKEEEKTEVKKDDDEIPKISCLPFSVKKIFSFSWKSKAPTK
jgi:hypothetical protein